MHTERFDTHKQATQRIKELRRIYGDSIEVFPLMNRWYFCCWQFSDVIHS
jgi:hypothetical protein